MNPFVFGIVLASACMHASWNALVKAHLEPLVAMTMVTIGGAIVSIPAIVVFGLPSPSSFPNAAGSTAVRLVYYLALTAAYRRGAMSEVYPIARGTGPLVATVAVVLLGEAIPAATLAGVVVLAAGVMLMAAARPRVGKTANMSAIGFALITGVMIASYTVIDGFGARRSGNPGGYVALLCILDAFPLTIFVLARRGLAAFRAMRRYLVPGFIGGALSVGAYGIALWAMTRASIPAVAALRETSVLFSTIIAVLFLGERFVPARAAAAAVIFSGILLIRLA